MSRSRALTLTLTLAGAVWIATVAAAFEAMRRFETTPGLPATAPHTWPAATTVPRKPGAWSLVMLVHPHCSCSRASISELAAIVESAPHDLQTSVLVYRPHEMPEGWERTAVYDGATRIPRVRVQLDRDGREAGIFGGFTSGQTFLYDDTGRLRFAGGITSLRGNAGLNRGRAAVINIATARSGEGTHPVFGCAILTSKPTGEKR